MLIPVGSLLLLIFNLIFLRASSTALEIIKCGNISITASPNAASSSKAFFKKVSLWFFRSFRCLSYSVLDFVFPICSETLFINCCFASFSFLEDSILSLNESIFVCAFSMFVLTAAIVPPVETPALLMYNLPKTVVFRSVLPIWFNALSITSKSNIEYNAFFSFPAASFPLTLRSAIMLSPSKKK